MQFIAQAQVKRQAGRDLPIILPIKSIGVAQAVHDLIIGGADVCVIRKSLQESRIRIANRRAHRGRPVKNIPARTIVPIDILVVITDALEVRAEFEGMLAVRPGHIVQRLNNLPALHSGVARAGGHIARDQHLRRFRPLQIRLWNGQAGLRQQRGG